MTFFEVHFLESSVKCKIEVSSIASETRIRSFLSFYLSASYSKILISHFYHVLPLLLPFSKWLRWFRPIWKIRCPILVSRIVAKQDCKSMIYRTNWIKGRVFYSLIALEQGLLTFKMYKCQILINLKKV